MHVLKHEPNGEMFFFLNEKNIGDEHYFGTWIFIWMPVNLEEGYFFQK